MMHFTHLYSEKNQTNKQAPHLISPDQQRQTRKYIPFENITEWALADKLQRMETSFHGATHTEHGQGSRILLLILHV